MKERAWLRMREAAALMGMTRLGAFKRLRRLQERTGRMFLRRDTESCPWEVNAAALRDWMSGETERREGKEVELSAKMENLIRRVGALRMTNIRLRKRIERLERLRLTDTSGN